MDYPVSGSLPSSLPSSPQSLPPGSPTPPLRKPSTSLPKSFTSVNFIDGCVGPGDDGYYDDDSNNIKSEPKSLFSRVRDYFSHTECMELADAEGSKGIEEFIKSGGSVKELSQAIEQSFCEELDNFIDLGGYADENKVKQIFSDKREGYVSKLNCALDAQWKYIDSPEADRSSLPLMTRISRAVSKFFGFHVDNYSQELLFLLSSTEEEASKDFLLQGGSVESAERHAQRLNSRFESWWVNSSNLPDSKKENLKAVSAFLDENITTLNNQVKEFNTYEKRAEHLISSQGDRGLYLAANYEHAGGDLETLSKKIKSCENKKEVKKLRNQLALAIQVAEQDHWLRHSFGNQKTALNEAKQVLVELDSKISEFIDEEVLDLKRVMNNVEYSFTGEDYFNVSDNSSTEDLVQAAEARLKEIEDKVGESHKGYLEVFNWAKEKLSDPDYIEIKGKLEEIITICNQQKQIDKEKIDSLMTGLDSDELVQKWQKSFDKPIDEFKKIIEGFYLVDRLKHGIEDDSRKKAEEHINNLRLWTLN